jgi:2-desacetyl-2-hydroxyethyl bacteriochlorophyllide A dehydrogenase
MRAAVINTFNSFDLCEVPKPVLEDGESLVRVLYNGICGTDLHLLAGNHPTAVYPLIAGHEFVGELAESKGAGGERFEPGDIVVAQELLTCGYCDPCSKGEDNVCEKLKIIGIHTAGAFAEYVKVMTRKMYKLPDGIDLRLAALIEPLAVALHDVRMSGLRVGETALVLGGGPIGMLIALVARANGASKVAISDVNGYRRQFAKDMGFDVVDPAETGFDRKLAALAGGLGFDVSFEAAGAPNTLATCIDHTKNTGTIVVIAMTKGEVSVDTGKIFAKELHLRGVRLHSQYNFVGAIRLVESGIINDGLKKLVTKIYPLSEISAAFDYAKNAKESFKVLVKVIDR